VRVNRRIAVKLLAVAPVAGADAFASRREQEREWIGPEYRTNPLQDWKLADGRMECRVAGGDRNVFLLTKEVGDRQGDLSMSVKLGRLEGQSGPLSEGFAGFRLGIKGQFNDCANAPRAQRSKHRFDRHRRTTDSHKPIRRWGSQGRSGCREELQRLVRPAVGNRFARSNIEYPNVKVPKR
jgi:hypothetical protein